jgi:hypothetical protein
VTRKEVTKARLAKRIIFEPRRILHGPKVNRSKYDRIYTRLLVDARRKKVYTTCQGLKASVVAKIIRHTGIGRKAA